MPDTSSQNSAIADLVHALGAEFDRFDSAAELNRRIDWVVEQLLRRDEDQPLLGKTKAAIDGFFATRHDADLAEIRDFCRQVVQISIQSRPSRAAAMGQAAAETRAAEEAEEAEDGDSSPPLPTRHDGFAELLAASLVYRVRHVTTFFHRRTKTVRRDRLPPFLLSPDFDERFASVITEHIAPTMMKNQRFVGALEHGRQWRRVSTEEFWTIVAEGEGLADRLLSTWRDAWNEFKPKRDDKTGKTVAPAALKVIRKQLAPTDPPRYAMAKIGGDLINLFGRLLSDLRPELDERWSMLSDIYEQELERRSYQDRTRDGAMMDAVTDLFPALPGRLGEFIAILCHFNMAKVDEEFLTQVTRASAGTIFIAEFLGTDASIS
ncbi:hypothetical protein CU669_07485 [Paramagnetospirillum kuznetsovii]|uniref:Uncharacterized protein n=1 Tax=Paramagnetospirillum kuznetsovii TaxID=2053833 RepID=A0A364NZM0_9PROT|nr:hypothetical protein [Paramagnetospirillum kuznetsovii]RAU22524.1 hypothetical protein CU669_07485 [Paramagnetospirillum kuznetsovii]